MVLLFYQVKTPPGRRCFEEAGCVMAHPVFGCGRRTSRSLRFERILYAA